LRRHGRICCGRGSHPRDLTPTLKDLGLAADRLDWTSEQALGIERLIKNNPRAIDHTAMRRLVQAAYDGDLAASAL
jgi:alcohol dehydrogenase class IV